MLEMPRWHTAGIFFRARLARHGAGPDIGPGSRPDSRQVRKVPLDAGFSCPNRDGAISTAGCSFCNPAGSGTGLFSQGLSLSAQWERLAPRARRRDPKARLLAYLQAYSNTHAAPERLRAVLAEVFALPEAAGLCLGTRPDCLDIGAGEERLDILAASGFSFLQLDLGLQSADDAVLALANRGHGAELFAAAARAAASRGIFVCAHVMHGLPGAKADDLARTVEFLNALPVAAVKFHNTLVCRGTALAALWRAGGYAPPTREEYVAALVDALSRLRPDICVERLFADPAPGELLAPEWASDRAGGKAAGLALARAELVRLGMWQGCRSHCPDAPPDWSTCYKDGGT
jgi:hypothetical protein